MQKYLIITLLGLFVLGCAEQESCGCENFGLEYTEGNFKAFFPQAFTPDGDGINDFVHPFFSPEFSSEGYSMHVKSGDLVVFSSTSPLEGWNGTGTEGDALPVGEYRVFLDFKNASGALVEKTFRLQLYRNENCGIPAAAASYKFGDQYDPVTGSFVQTSQVFCP